MADSRAYRMAAGLTVVRSRAVAMLLVPLALSAFTHLWNPTGFPDIFYDEGVYMRRAMDVLGGDGPQEGRYYDHPYFGQLFLAGTLAATGYPGSLDLDGSAQSMEALYMAPRIIMGILAIADSFLVFKIAEKRYGRTVAFIAALLFAVMPATWLLRRILLDSILLPFMLSSILVALHVKDSRRPVLMAALAGALIGLAIFTKIPAFAMMPLVGYAVASGSRRKAMLLAAFLVPAILLPMIWPLYSVSANEFGSWAHYALAQAQRHSGGIVAITKYLFGIDPVLLVAGAAGIAYSLWRRDAFAALWALPFLVFLSVIGYVQYFHWIPLLPVFCIAAGRAVSDVLAAKKKTVLAVVAGIVAFGMVSTALLVTTNMTSAQFRTLAYASDYLDKNENGHGITTLAGPVYSWVLGRMYKHENVMTDYSSVLSQRVKTDKVLLIADRHFFIDIGRGHQLQDFYDQTRNLQVMEGNARNYDQRIYPFSSMSFNQEGSRIEIRAN